jgi:hypothetical protein
MALYDNSRVSYDSNVLYDSVAPPHALLTRTWVVLATTLVEGLALSDCDFVRSVLASDRRSGSYQPRATPWVHSQRTTFPALKARIIRPEFTTP